MTASHCIHLVVFENQFWPIRGQSPMPAHEAVYWNSRCRLALLEFPRGIGRSHSLPVRPFPRSRVGQFGCHFSTLPGRYQLPPK